MRTRNVPGCHEVALRYISPETALSHMRARPRRDVQCGTLYGCNEERAGNSGVWQQVQRKINGEINDAISNGRTTLNTYRSLGARTEAHSHQETVTAAHTLKGHGCTPLKSDGPPIIVTAMEKALTIYCNHSNGGVMRGERGSFAFGYGHIGDDVLEYVNAKNGLHELTSEQLRDMEMDTFDAPHMAHNRSWQSRSADGDKIQFAGKMCATPTGAVMNTLSLKRYLFTKGWVAWREAFFSID